MAHLADAVRGGIIKGSVQVKFILFLMNWPYSRPNRLLTHTAQTGRIFSK
jgi:hypothetical protein